LSRSYTNRSIYPISRGGQQPHGEQMFTCVRCGLPITCAPLVAGVQNRNHCPACLWSRHLDWRVAGDRLSNCRAAMEPIGLTTKRSRNKYARERDGELMLIHRCAGCGKLSINRVAADDGEAEIVELFERSLELGPALAAELGAADFEPLAADDRDLVLRRLFGASGVARAALAAF
jgi:uncharacterized C2H2 Zn-finger protein